MITPFFGYIGRKVFRIKDIFVALFKDISGVYYLTRHTMKCSFIEPLKGRPVKWKSMWIQMEEVGVKSALIVFLTLFLIGVILAIQTAYQMSQFGALEYVGALVGVAITRELGPLLTALVMAGRVGAAFTAELGTMKVSDEILALETMALDPIKFLIAPRFLALIIMLPCLTILGNLMGIFGGFLVGVTTLGIDPVIYIDRSIEAIQVKDVFSGLFKSSMFALIIVMIGSYLAFIIEGGAEKVGQNTRSAVVTSMILIIIADMVFTAFFFFLE
jgi:phospholipid/cholesterol/gamma-HCH transport system permease protein|tara:strand:+ start:379 stop:1197 length:819 start_codon:yes stop_codon:yes gene_type:complete